MKARQCAMWVAARNVTQQLVSNVRKALVNFNASSQRWRNKTVESQKNSLRKCKGSNHLKSWVVILHLAIRNGAPELPHPEALAESHAVSGTWQKLGEVRFGSIRAFTEAGTRGSKDELASLSLEILSTWPKLGYSKCLNLEDLEVGFQRPRIAFDMPLIDCEFLPGSPRNGTFWWALSHQNRGPNSLSTCIFGLYPQSNPVKTFVQSWSIKQKHPAVDNLPQTWSVKANQIFAQWFTTSPSNFAIT